MSQVTCDVVNGKHLPVYLDVTWDNTLSQKKHLMHTAAQLKAADNNRIMKLAGLSCGATACIVSLLNVRYVRLPIPAVATWL